jgi:hypothetical protein
MEREDRLELAGNLSLADFRAAQLQGPCFLTPAGCESNHSNQQTHNRDSLSVHGVLQKVSLVQGLRSNPINTGFDAQTKSQLSIGN